jgi:non-ribosomal peptide synthase protein (TIGR01720 family)
MTADLEARIAVLPPAERRLLADRLGLSQVRSERLVAFVTAVEQSDGMTEDLREHLRTRLPAYMIPQNIVCIDAMPRTPSGKLDRQALADRPLQREPTAAQASDSVLSEAERTLIEIWSDVLGIDEINVNDDFFELGGDSLLSIRILSKATSAGFEIEPEDFLDHPTIAAQAMLAVKNRSSNEQPEAPQAGALPLTPIQAWFFEHIHNSRDQWNQSLDLAVRDPLDKNAAQQLLNKLIARHDALRTSFRQTSAGGWEQHVALAASVELRYLDLSDETPASRTETISNTSLAMHQSITLSQAPLCRATYFRLTPEEDRLLLVFHHLVIDEFSLGLLTEELGNPSGMQAPRSMANWSAHLAAPDTAAQIADEASYWLERAGSAPLALPRIPAAVEANVEGNRVILHAVLDEETTTTLVSSLTQLRETRLVEGLLAALVRALSDWCGVSEIPVILESHGRDQKLGLDTTTTIGWLTHAYPAWLSAGESSDSIDTQLARLRESYRAVPGSGVAYGLLRTHGSPSVRDALAQAPYPEVCVNFLSRPQMISDDAPFQRLPPSDGPYYRSNDCERAHLLEVNAHVTNAGALLMDWIYCSRFHDPNTIAALADATLDSLRQFAAFRGNDAVATPADFPLADLDGAGLDDVARLLQDADERSGSN